MEASKYQHAEYRISIYGRKRVEWDMLAAWYCNNRLYSDNVLWLIQASALGLCGSITHVSGSISAGGMGAQHTCALDQAFAGGSSGSCTARAVDSCGRIATATSACAATAGLGMCTVHLRP